MRRRRLRSFIRNRFRGEGGDVAGVEPGNDFPGAQHQEVLAFPVPVEIFRVMVGLQDHNLVRILYVPVKVLADIAVLFARGFSQASEQHQNLIGRFRLGPVMGDYVKHSSPLRMFGMGNRAMPRFSMFRVWDSAVTDVEAFW